MVNFTIWFKTTFFILALVFYVHYVFCPLIPPVVIFQLYRAQSSSSHANTGRVLPFDSPQRVCGLATRSKICLGCQHGNSWVSTWLNKALHYSISAEPWQRWGFLLWSVLGWPTYFTKLHLSGTVVNQHGFFSPVEGLASLESKTESLYY